MAKVTSMTSIRLTQAGEYHPADIQLTVDNYLWIGKDKDRMVSTANTEVYVTIAEAENLIEQLRLAIDLAKGGNRFMVHESRKVSLDN